MTDIRPAVPQVDPQTLAAEDEQPRLRPRGWALAREGWLYAAASRCMPDYLDDLEVDR